MITAAQRAERIKYACSSDLPAILGVDPYRSPADVWLEKTGRAEGFEGNEHTERGELLEPALLTWAERTIGRGFLRDQMILHPNGLAAANCDGISPEDRFIVEGKTTVNGDEWGEEGTDEVPERVIVQTHHQMIVASRRFGVPFTTAYVPVLLPGFRDFDWRLYQVSLNEDLAAMVEQAGADFITKYVRTHTPPTDYRPSLEVLKRVRRRPDVFVDLPDELVDALVVAKAEKKQAEERAKEAEAALLAALGDSEGGRYSRGEVTYMETKRKGYTVDACVYRSLRIKAEKENT